MVSARLAPVNRCASPLSRASAAPTVSASTEESAAAARSVRGPNPADRHSQQDAIAVVDDQYTVVVDGKTTDLRGKGILGRQADTPGGVAVRHGSVQLFEYPLLAGEGDSRRIFGLYDDPGSAREREDGVPHLCGGRHSANLVAGCFNGAAADFAGHAPQVGDDAVFVIDAFRGAPL